MKRTWDPFSRLARASVGGAFPSILPLAPPAICHQVSTLRQHTPRRPAPHASTPQPATALPFPLYCSSLAPSSSPPPLTPFLLQQQSLGFSPYPGCCSPRLASSPGPRHPSSASCIAKFAGSPPARLLKHVESHSLNSISLPVLCATTRFTSIHQFCRIPLLLSGSLFLSPTHAVALASPTACVSKPVLGNTHLPHHVRPSAALVFARRRFRFFVVCVFDSSYSFRVHDG